MSDAGEGKIPVVAIRTLIVLLTAMLLVGCLAQPQPRQAKFNLNEYLPYGGTGTAGIYGEAFLTTPGGNVKKAMGNKVYLNPVTTYSTEWFQREVLGGQLTAEGDPRAAPYLHEAVVASDGKFEFENLPAGDYYIACPISWEVLDTTSDGTTFAGGWASAKVSLKAGERKQIVLTR
jgi:hypothetical protein